MLQGIPRISVYIITYNQIDVIDRTLKSVLDQSDYVYEICISDDHSTDGTWERLQEYSEQYPGLFKLNRNDPNLGIFENTEKVWTMPTGDVVYDLAGDDCVGEGWFKAVVGYIQENKIDYKKEHFCIYGDYICIYPNGDAFRYKNKAIESGIDPFRLAFRGLISNRSACYSINILRKFPNISNKRSHVVEDVMDRFLQIFTTNNYYIKYIGNIYYAQIGVSSKLTPKIVSERMFIKKYTLEYLKTYNINIDKTDVTYASYSAMYEKYSYNHSLVDAYRLMVLLLKSFDYKLPLDCSFFHRLIFSLRRRLPHFNPISM